MCRPPLRVRIESDDKTSAERNVLLLLLRISLSNTLCVRRRPESRRPLPKSDEFCAPVGATPRRQASGNLRKAVELSQTPHLAPSHTPASVHAVADARCAQGTTPATTAVSQSRAVVGGLVGKYVICVIETKPITDCYLVLLHKITE